MSSPLIISVSGLRGEIGRSLTPDVAVRYALAFSTSVDSTKPFVVANDGRRSGALFTDAVCAALNAAGRTVIDAGVAATPTVGALVKSTAAAGGIQISASHNPRQYNGMKLFSSEGRVIPKTEGESVLASYRSLCDRSSLPRYADVDSLGERIRMDDSTSAHLQLVLKTVDLDLIRAHNFSVVLDSNNASGSILGKRLLDALNCRYVILGDSADGSFLHMPEPTEENLESVVARSREFGADAVFCQDPDADRLAVIDENGRYVGEEYTTAICCKNRLQKARVSGETAPFNLVINCASSRMTLDIAEEFGGKCFRSPVGEANVVDLMKAKDAVYGGEGNGGPIDPRVGYVRDSFVGIAQTLEMMARNNQKLSEVADAIKGYSIVKRKVGLPTEGFQKIVELVAREFANESINLEDGVRVDFADSWVLARPSNTEPIARVIAEAPTMEQAEALCDRVEKIMGF